MHEMKVEMGETPGSVEVVLPKSFKGSSVVIDSNGGVTFKQADERVSGNCRHLEIEEMVLVSNGVVII